MITNPSLDTFQEIADLNANRIDVRTCQSCDDRYLLGMIYAGA
jgi:hypothetical protein